jgi:hypothetical protein
VLSIAKLPTCYRTLLEKPGFLPAWRTICAFETLCGAKKPLSSAKNLVSVPRCKKCPVVKLPIAFSDSSTHAVDWCISSAVTEVVSHRLCTVWPGVGKGLARIPSRCFVSAPKRGVISFGLPFERRMLSLESIRNPANDLVNMAARRTSILCLRLCPRP